MKTKRDDAERQRHQDVRQILRIGQRHRHAVDEFCHFDMANQPGERGKERHKLTDNQHGSDASDQQGTIPGNRADQHTDDHHRDIRRKAHTAVFEHGLRHHRRRTGDIGIGQNIQHKAESDTHHDIPLPA